MSRRTSSGSRFQSLPVEGESSGSDSSAEEMKLSKDFYPQHVSTGIGTSQRKRSTSGRPRSGMSSQSFSEQMKLPTSSRGSKRSKKGSLAQKEPEKSDLGRTGRNSFENSQRKHVKSRDSIKPIASSDLYFKMDHFAEPKKVPDHQDHFADVAIDAVAVDNLFGKGSTGSLPATAAQLSKNIDEDVKILRETGFNIDYSPGGELGEGYYGTVYKGHYGADAPDLGTNRFAVKIIEFGNKTDTDTLERRERFETEKYILTAIYHKNVVAIRMIINMGEIRAYPFVDNPGAEFLSPDRVYLIMDYADLGQLEEWLPDNYKNLTPAYRINLIRDVFHGMLYLHSKNIIHGDAHGGNVLIFSDTEGVVAKWADFGLGHVGSDKQYRFRKPKDVDLPDLRRMDILYLTMVLGTLVSHRHLSKPETEEEKKLMEQALALNRVVKDKSTNDLVPVDQFFEHILHDELIFDEEHYK